MSIKSFSPSDPTDLVAELPDWTEQEVAAAFQRARAAQREWWAMGAAGRAAALNSAADKLQARATEAAQLMVREVGKPIAEANGEAARCISILRYYAQSSFIAKGDVYPPSAKGFLWSERRPHGVAGLITPWNFPMAIPLWKAAPALAAGNAVVIKPSTEAIGCAAMLETILSEVLPAGLFQLVPSRTITSHADVISFTGSNEVGQQVAQAAAARGVPVQCEMGGQNAAIVLADRDVETAVAHITMASMFFAGQKCTATRRIITVGEQPDFIDAYLHAVNQLGVGDPAENSNLVGPLINEAARNTFNAAVTSARAIGADVRAGGGELERAGWFVQPTVLAGVPADHPLSCQEVFGPLVTLHVAADVAEAIELANAVPYGLVTSVHGRNHDEIMQVVNGADTGMIKVNAATAGVDFYAPFGGEKDSSIGMREQGTAALEFYSSTRTITYAPSR